MELKRYLIFAGEKILVGWKGFWCGCDSAPEAIEYAAWLVEMPLHEPEAKASWSQVADTETNEVIYEGVRE